MGAPEETWVDVTAALRSGVQKLSMGETLCAQGFELEQAISAAEIGDPRMDPPLNPDMHVDALVEQGKMAVVLSLEQHAALLDALTVSMVQWWTGNPLHLTLYTSLHLAAREQVPMESPILRASVDVVQNLIDIARHISHHSGVVVVRHSACHSRRLNVFTHCSILLQQFTSGSAPWYLWAICRMKTSLWQRPF